MLMIVSEWEKRNRRKPISICEIVEGISNAITLQCQIVTLSIADSWYVAGYRTRYAYMLWEDAVCFKPVDGDDLLREIKRQGFHIWRKAKNGGAFFYVTGKYDIPGREEFMAEQGYYKQWN